MAEPVNDSYGRTLAAGCPDGPPKRGISHIVALALVVMDLDVVRRSTILALCPTDATKIGASKVSPQVQAGKALRKFEYAGWGRREGKFFRVLDSEKLFEWVCAGVDVTPDRAMSLLAVAAAARAIASAPLAMLPADELEARERELQALDRLMRRAPGAVTNARGTRRLVHKPSSMIDLSGVSE